MMMRTGIMCSLALLLAVTPTFASHDGGESVEVLSASKDGRYVLASWRDVNEDDIRVAIHDASVGQFVVEEVVASSAVPQKVAALRRKYRLQRLPRARHCDSKRNICVFAYSWSLADGSHSRAMALVGPMSQVVAPAKSVPCYREGPECKATPAKKRVAVKAYWLGKETLLIADTWVVKKELGDTYVPFFIHRTRPKTPTIPDSPPASAKPQ